MTGFEPEDNELMTSADRAVRENFTMEQHKVLEALEIIQCYALRSRDAQGDAQIIAVVDEVSNDFRWLLDKYGVDFTGHADIGL